MNIAIFVVTASSLFLMFLISSHDAFANQTISIKEYGFTMEIPNDWKQGYSETPDNFGKLTPYGGKYLLIVLDVKDSTGFILVTHDGEYSTNDHAYHFFYEHTEKNQQITHELNASYKRKNATEVDAHGLYAIKTDFDSSLGNSLKSLIAYTFKTPAGGVTIFFDPNTSNGKVESVLNTIKIDNGINWNSDESKKENEYFKTLDTSKNPDSGSTLEDALKNALHVIQEKSKHEYRVNNPLTEMLPPRNWYGPEWDVGEPGDVFIDTTGKMPSQMDKAIAQHLVKYPNSRDITYLIQIFRDSSSSDASQHFSTATSALKKAIQLYHYSFDEFDTSPIGADSCYGITVEADFPKTMLFCQKNEFVFVVANILDISHEGQNDVKNIANYIATRGNANGASVITTKATSIPSWIKNNAKWWSEGSLTDDDFIKGVQYMIQQGIMKIPQTQSGSGSSQQIPTWVKNNSGWWANGQISDDEFVKGIDYLVQSGIIKIENQVSTQHTTESTMQNNGPLKLDWCCAGSTYRSHGATVTVTVTDKDNNPVQSVSVNVTASYDDERGIIQSFNSTTDKYGKTTISWKLGDQYRDGIEYPIIVTVDKPGFLQVKDVRWLLIVGP